MNKLYLSLLLFWIAAMPLQVFGGDYLGGYISYEWLHGDTLSVTAIIYRDCRSSAVENGFFRIKSSNGKFDTLLAYETSRGLNITPACHIGECNPCADLSCSLSFGVKRYELRSKIYLGHINSCGFNIQMQGCCRSNMLTNLQPNQGYFISAYTDKCSNNKSSPMFSDPNIFSCLAECYGEILSATDKTPNTIKYRLVVSLSKENIATAYTSSFAYNQPLSFYGFPYHDQAYNPPYCKGFHLDSTTGELSYKPMHAEGTVLTVKAEEIDTGGNITGFTIFDIPQISKNCTFNDEPMISGINGSNSQYSVRDCYGAQTCFNIMTGDLNGDSVKLWWDAGIPGASFTVTQYGKIQYGRFCWTSSKEDFRAEPYIFTVTAKDNGCPAKTAMRAFMLYVEDYSLHTSVEDVIKPELKIYPNPAKEMVQIELPQNIVSYSLQMVSTDGKLVRKIDASASQTTIIRRNQLPAGMYLLELKAEGVSYYYPIIFQ